MGPKPRRKKKGDEPKSKPSAIELLARLSGKKRMEPTVNDAVEEIEASRIFLQKLKLKSKQPQDIINSADGAVIGAEAQYRDVAGGEYRKRPQVRDKDQKALMDLFEATHGFRWGEVFGWVGRKGRSGRLPLAHFEMNASHWYGIHCEIGENELCVVVTISLSDNDLEGPLPKTLCSLSYLRELDLSQNILEGPLPDKLLSSLPELQTLKLCANQLSGDICEVLAISKTQTNFCLRVLDLSFNLFYGELPKDFLHTPLYGYLIELDLSNNQLSGPLQPHFTSHGGGGGGGSGEEEEELICESLRVLRLSNNQFTGPIPDSFSTLELLRDLDLSNNNLTGNIPHYLCECTRLSNLNFSRNSFTGNIPPKLAELNKLECLNLQHNQLTGPIPQDIGILPWLKVFNVSHNHLHGPIPHSIEQMKRVEVLLTHHNEGLHCPIPEGLSKLTSLLDVSLIDSSPSRELNAPRHYDSRLFYKTRIEAPSIGMNNWFAPG